MHTLNATHLSDLVCQRTLNTQTVHETRSQSVRLSLEMSFVLDELNSSWQCMISESGPQRNADAHHIHKPSLNATSKIARLRFTYVGNPKCQSFPLWRTIPTRSCLSKASPSIISFGSTPQSSASSSMRPFFSQPRLFAFSYFFCAIPQHCTSIVTNIQVLSIG